MYSEVEVLLVSHNGLEGVLGQVEEAGVTDPPVNIKGDVLVKEFLGDLGDCKGLAKL